MSDRWVVFIFHPAYYSVKEYLQVTESHSRVRSAYREPASCVVEFPSSEKFPLCLPLHQRALRPEIAANLSFISWLNLFRPEGIDMQTRWFSYRSAERAFIQKSPGSIPDTFLCLSHNGPSCQWSMWASGSTEGGQAPNTHGLGQTRIPGWMDECHSLRSLHQ